MSDAYLAYRKELKKIGARIKQLRKHRKLRLLDIEMSSGIADTHMSQYEKGKLNLELFTLFKIAIALQVDIKALLDYDGPLPDNSNFKVPPKARKTTRAKKKKP